MWKPSTVKYKYEVVILPPPEDNAHRIKALSLLDECNDDIKDGDVTLEANNEDVEVLIEEGAVRG